MRNNTRAGQAAETARFVWTTNEFHQIRLDQKTHLISPIAETDQRRLAAVLALPFFWHLSVDGLKSRYRIELVMEQPETGLLHITPPTKIGRESFDRSVSCSP